MAKDDSTFERYPEIEFEEACFKNRYGIELAGVVFKPADGADKHPAVVVSSPFGTVREQSESCRLNCPATKRRCISDGRTVR